MTKTIMMKKQIMELMEIDIKKGTEMNIINKVEMMEAVLMEVHKEPLIIDNSL